MSKILLFSDAHIHTHKNSLQRLQHCLEALEWVLQTAQNRGIEDVLFLGDLFQDRQKIQVLPYHKTYQIIQKYARTGLRLYMLVGNHDMWYADRTDVSSVFPFNAIENVTVISEPSQLIIQDHPVDFLPYTHNPLESTNKLLKNAARVLCGHIAINGAQLNTFYKTSIEVSVEYEGDMVKVDPVEFKKWDRVFLGHYHGAQRLEHIEYVGSPLELNFAEAFQNKHAIVLDLDNLETEYIENTFSPRHLIVNQSDLTKYDLNNTFIKLKPDDISSADLVDLQNQLMRDHNILNLEFAIPDHGDDGQQIEDAKDIIVNDKQEMIVRFVTAVGTNGLIEPKLLDIGKDIIQRSQIS